MQLVASRGVGSQTTLWSFLHTKVALVAVADSSAARHASYRPYITESTTISERTAYIYQYVR
jgi:hypothetical protein